MSSNRLLKPKSFDIGPLLLNNEPLAENAHDEARILLNDSERALARLDIGYPIFTSVQNQRTRLVNCIASYRTVLAPHRRVPPEILAEIFQYCVYEEIRVLSVPFTAPLDLVCRKWRQVAISTSNLWNRVYIDYGNFHDYTVLTNTAKQRLGRSGNSPISLVIEGYCTSRISSNPIADLVIPYSSRLKYLSVSCSMISWIEPFLQLPAGSVGRLEYVKITLHGNQPLKTDTKVFKGARTLQEVAIISESHPTALHLPWAQLTNLHLSTSLDHNIARSILTHCTLLLHCYFKLGRTGIKSRTSSNLGSSVLVLSVLLSLEVHLDSDSSSLFFVNFLAPHLTLFKLLQTPSEYWKPSVTYHPLVSQSRHIETLDISVRVPMADIERLLVEVPSVVNLLFPLGDPFSSSAVKMISCGEIIPQLKVLSCVVDSLGDFLDMLECRRTSTPPIESVTILVRTKEYSRVNRIRVDELKAKGLDILLRRDYYYRF